MQKYTTLGVVLFLLALPPFFSGGKADWVAPAAMIGTSLLLAFSVFTRKQEINPGLARNILYAVGIFILGALLSTVFSVAPYKSFGFFALLLTYTSLFYAVYSLNLKEKEIKIILSVIVGISAMLVLWGAYMFTGSSYPRMISLFFWPNAFAGYLLFSLPIALGFYIREKHGSRVILLGLTTALIGGALYLTQTRGAFISTAIALLPLLYWTRSVPKKELALKLGGVVLATAGIAGLLFIARTGEIASPPSPSFSNLAEKNDTTTGNSAEGRLIFWKNGVEMWRDNPITGTGLNTWEDVYPQYQDSPINFARRAHNQYVQWLAETGVIGITPFLAFTVLIIWGGIKAMRRENFYAVVIFAGVFGSLMHNFVDFDWYFPANALTFWILAGILVSLYEKQSA